MTFAAPLYLVLIPVVLTCVYLFFSFVWTRSSRNAYAYSSLAFAEHMFTRNALIERTLLGGVMCACVCGVVALAQPRIDIPVAQRDGAIVLCFDTSGSMASGDIVPTRAQAALKAAHLFVTHLPGGVKVGIVSFSSVVDPLLRPTDDAVNAAIEQIPMPNGATAIGDALLAAQQMMPSRGRRAIVLLTDGVNNRGSDPLEAAQALAQAHITLYTVGIGTNNSGQIIPGTSEEADADPDALRQYAETTGGKFAAVKDATEIAAAFLQLSHETTWQSQRIDIALPAALASAVLFAGSLFLGLQSGDFRPYERSRSKRCPSYRAFASQL